MHKKAKSFVFKLMGMGGTLALLNPYIPVYAGILDPSLSRPITPQLIEQSDTIILEGAVAWDKIDYKTKATTFTSPLGIKIDANELKIPFEVKKSTDAEVGKLVQIKLFFPTNPNDRIRWALPLKEPLILFVTKDLKEDNTYDLIYPQSCWVPAVRTNDKSFVIKAKSQFILDQLKLFLQWRLDHPEQPIKYFDTLDRPEQGFSVNPDDPSLVRALQIGERFGQDDLEFQAIVAKYVNNPQTIGELSRQILSSSGNYTDLLARVRAFEQGQLTGLEEFNFPQELENDLVASRDLSKAMPLIEIVCNSPNPKVRLAGAFALRDRQWNDPKLYPLLVKLLGDSGWETQYAAMGCIYDMSGSANQPFGKEDLHLPDSDLFKANPDLYLKQYKDWWEKHKDALQ